MQKMSWPVGMATLAAHAVRLADTTLSQTIPTTLHLQTQQETHPLTPINTHSTPPPPLQA